MKRRCFQVVLLLIFGVELGGLFLFSAQDTENLLDSVAVNEERYSVQENWNRMEAHRGKTGLDYAVIDNAGKVLFRTRAGLSENMNQAVIHRDTIVDVEQDGHVVGKILIYNNGEELLVTRKRAAVVVLGTSIAVQAILYMSYTAYLNRRMIRPFQDMKHFARRVAGGNLDIPLEMDRYNLFGAFTESFDIMRAELKRARVAEAKANADKKELVAKLSHDIKTPVASIQAAAEVGAALAEHVRSGTAEKNVCSGGAQGQEELLLAGMGDNYLQIIRKAEQINTLVTNLFTATLEEMEQLTVTPGDMESGELTAILESADYLHRAVLPAVPDCLLYGDRLRLQQVFDNLFANSYKYADTKIDVTLETGGGYLAVEMEDRGGGVGSEELPLIKEKFRRGSNAKEAEGAGLGLYIADYFMKAMQGKLLVENGEKGLRVTVVIRMSGCDTAEQIKI